MNIIGGLYSTFFHLQTASWIHFHSSIINSTSTIQFIVLPAKSIDVTCSVCYPSSQSLTLFWKEVNDQLFAMAECFIMHVIIKKHNTVPCARMNAVWKESIVHKARWLEIQMIR